MHSIVLRFFFAALLASALAGCGASDPGPLKSTWRMAGVLAMTVQFRAGETEALGIIEKVTYEKSGLDIVVKYETGLMKGSAMRYTMIDENTARSEVGSLQRVN
jgi:hypothetical protein